MHASVASQSGRTLPSRSSTRSPRRTPCARSQFATWFDRARIRAKVTRSSRPPSPTIHSATRSPGSPSKWSSAQLNRSSAGQRNAVRAASRSSRCRSRRSRAAWKGCVATGGRYDPSRSSNKPAPLPRVADARERRSTDARYEPYGIAVTKRYAYKRLSSRAVPLQRRDRRAWDPRPSCGGPPSAAAGR